MLKYLAKRLLLTIPTLLLVAVIVFLLVRLVPGDPAQVMLGEGADPAAVAAMHHEMGLDRPLAVQFTTAGRLLPSKGRVSAQRARARFIVRGAHRSSA